MDDRQTVPGYRHNMGHYRRPFSVLFRLQLGYPGQSFRILETLLGKWANGGILSTDGYYALVTMHGTIMIFFVLTADLSGTFANFLIPLRVGARDMASPFLNKLSYWFFFAASVVMLSLSFCGDGPCKRRLDGLPPAQRPR